MADFVTVPEVAVAMRRELTAEEEAWAAVLVVAASAIIRARFPDIDDRIEAGQLPAVLANYVATTMVTGVLGQRDPEAPIEEQAGPFRERWSEAALGLLQVTAEMAALLAGPGGGRRAPRSIGLGLGICPP